MKKAQKKALVIGAGVIGLTTAVRLAEHGYKTEIWTKEPPEETTSATAAAFWEPFLVKPEDKAAEWGKVSFEEFRKLSEEYGEACGVEPRTLFSVFTHAPEIPAWSKVLPSFRSVGHAELSKEFEGTMPEKYTHGFIFSAWMVEMPKYLPFLSRRFEEHGKLTKRVVQHIDEALEEYSLVINCSALGSRDIGGIEDTTVFPVAGQVAQIGRTIEKSILFDTEQCTYIVARGKNVILGGTAREHVYDRTPKSDISKDIVRRCSAFFKHLSEADIQLEMTGLRPAREAVRLEREMRGPGKFIIHNYGHGGGGVTLSWGCAQNVVELADEVTTR